VKSVQKSVQNLRGDVMAEKKRRLCPLKQKKVTCDGLCKAVLEYNTPHLCSVYVEWFDSLVNC